MKLLTIAVMAAMFISALSFQAHSASIALVEDQTFIIPGFSSVDDFRFADINSDGKFEILVRQKAYVAFYASEFDSILWEYDLDPAQFYGILAADITRDSIVDIIVGRYIQNSEYSDSSVTIDIFDGATKWADMTRYYSPTVSYSGYWGPYFHYQSYGGFTIFNTCDINGDGYNEFLVSYGNKVFETNSLEYRETVNGRTWMYYHYPDSLIWQFGMLCENARPVNPGYSNLLTANSRYYLSHTGHGPDYYESRLNLRLLSESGTSLLLSHPLETVAYEKVQIYDYGVESAVQVEASGFIDWNNDHPDLLIRYYWSGFNNLGGTSESHLDKRLYNLLESDSCELNWITDYGYLNKHTSLPDFTGVYFAFGNDSINMFSGNNGGFLDGAPATPASSSKWLIMPDNSVRLVSVSGNTIHTQRVDKVTDVGDNPATPIPDQFSLGHPYPNPFNAEQTIPVTINPGERLTVDIYNLLGQKIDELFSGVSYSKEMKLNWHAGDLASGVYLIRAQSGGQTAIVRSVLLK